MIELMSDVGTAGLLVRHPRGREPRFVHTIWTIRLIRSCINFCIVFFGAPLVAYLYHTPMLAGAFRTISFWFLISGTESMSFILSQRDQRARIYNYSEMISGAIGTATVIALAATVLRNHYALIYGSMLQRLLVTIASYFFYRDIGVRIAFDREAIRDQFLFARFVLPSSILTIILSQYDKLVLLKLFNLTLLGIYGVAQNMLNPISGVVQHNATVLLYARCSEYFRTNRDTARIRYYTENHRLMLIGVVLPSLLAGFSQLVVAVLYDSRYSMAGPILMVLSLSALVIAFQNASENLLLAAGLTHTKLVTNIVRFFSIIPATLIGGYYFGIFGFLWFSLAANIALLSYLYAVQKKHRLLNLGNEVGRLGIALVIFLLSLGASHLILMFLPSGLMHRGRG
jgi:O-antigen/teichoic acid export membrane protein